jgi:dimethylaniline monooxygenase (N-oxide forming)
MTLAIIGAGPSGLAAAKSAIECGLDPTVFEKGSSIGGLWKPKGGCVWDSMRTNISHHTCAFSDHPWKDSVDSFPHQSEVYEYLCSYADTFKIHPHVHLNTEVKKVQLAGEKWQVEWVDHENQTTQGSFDYLVVCSGVFSKAFTPSIPGMADFKGLQLHAKDYKTPDAFAGKSVTVIGNAFSGTEVAAEIAQTAQQVTHVIRRPVWVLPRYLAGPNPGQKLPGDLIFYSRAANARNQGIPQAALNAQKSQWFQSICSSQGEICPDLKMPVPSEAPAFVTISDAYLEQIKAGKIAVCAGEVAKLQEDAVLISGKDPLKSDALLFCTGYQASLPFFDPQMQSLLEIQEDDLLQPFLMHKTVFHPEFPAMAFVGMYRGPFFAAMELQARMACMTFSGKIPFPTQEMIQEGLLEEKRIREAVPRPQFPHGDYVRFCDDLAKHIGVLPDFEQMKQESPDLFDQLWNGPFTPASFRLTGFGSKPEAALKTILRINLAAKPEGGTSRL